MLGFEFFNEQVSDFGWKTIPTHKGFERMNLPVE